MEHTYIAEMREDASTRSPFCREIIAPKAIASVRGVLAAGVWRNPLLLSNGYAQVRYDIRLTSLILAKRKIYQGWILMDVPVHRRLPKHHRPTQAIRPTIMSAAIRRPSVKKPRQGPLDAIRTSGTRLLSWLMALLCRLRPLRGAVRGQLTINDYHTRNGVSIHSVCRDGFLSALLSLLRHQREHLMRGSSIVSKRQVVQHLYQPR